MTPSLVNYIMCRPEKPDAKCNNCKRWIDRPDQQSGHINSVKLKNSKSKACIYIPISLQEKV